MRFSHGAILALFLVFVLAGCATQCAENFDAVHDGLNKAQVRDLLGEPSSTWVDDAGLERWQWGDSLSSLATSSLFHEADSSRVWVVWFDADGRVNFFKQPDWVERR